MQKSIPVLLFLVLLLAPTSATRAEEGINSTGNLLPVGAGGKTITRFYSDGLIKFFNPTDNSETASINTATGSVDFKSNRSNGRVYPFAAIDSVTGTATTIFGWNPAVGFNYAHNSNNPQVYKGGYYASEIMFTPNDGKLHFKFYDKKLQDFAVTSLLSEPMTLTKDGNVGIGTTDPQAKLDVIGGIKVGIDNSACNTSTAGTIRWNGQAFQGCDGASWRNILNDQDSFGGMYFVYNDGGCRYGNPKTGTCSCPAGYRGNTIWDFVVPAMGWWSRSGNSIVYCTKDTNASTASAGNNTGSLASLDCPEGKYLSGIDNGAAICKDVPVSVGTAGGGAPALSCRVVQGGAPTGGGLWSVAQCNDDETVTGGGGFSEIPGSPLCASTSRGFLHHSAPLNNGWAVDGYSFDWSGEVCTRSYAVCCKVVSNGAATPQTSAASLSCPDGQYMSGITNGVANCKNLPSSVGTSNTACPSGNCNGTPLLATTASTTNYSQYNEWVYRGLLLNYGITSVQQQVDALYIWNSCNVSNPSDGNQMDRITGFNNGGKNLCAVQMCYGYLGKLPHLSHFEGWRAENDPQRPGGFYISSSCLFTK